VWIVLLAALSMPAQQPQAPSGAELEKFVAAYEAVSIIRVKLQEDLANVDDSNVANRLQQEADGRMVAALEQEAMEPKRYNELSQIIAKDEVLLARFQQMRAELQRKQDKGSK
jgi:hypothetical protein